MTQNYFSIERADECIDHVYIKREDGAVMFEDIMNMSYDEIKACPYIDEFVVCVMDAANEHFGNKRDDKTIITLVGKDDVFIWGILIGPDGSEDRLRYVFIDWKKDGKSYRYEKD